MTLAAFCQSLDAATPTGHIERIGRRLYLVPPALLPLSRTIPETPYSIGTYLGEERGAFVASPALLAMLEPPPTRITTLNTRGSWLFICGRRVRAQHILGRATRDPCLVRNEAGETLGLGRFERSLLIPLVDLGTYLRDQ